LDVPHSISDMRGNVVSKGNKKSLKRCGRNVRRNSTEKKENKRKKHTHHYELPWWNSDPCSIATL